MFGFDPRDLVELAVELHDLVAAPRNLHNDRGNHPRVAAAKTSKMTVLDRVCLFLFRLLSGATLSTCVLVLGGCSESTVWRDWHHILGPAADVLRSEVTWPGAVEQQVRRRQPRPGRGVREILQILRQLNPYGPEWFVVDGTQVVISRGPTFQMRRNEWGYKFKRSGINQLVFIDFYGFVLLVTPPAPAGLGTDQRLLNQVAPQLVVHNAGGGFEGVSDRPVGAAAGTMAVLDQGSATSGSCTRRSTPLPNARARSSST